MKSKFGFWAIIAIIALIGFSATACDPGGDDEVIYELGDTGPGGGIIFYRNLSGFTVQGYSGGQGSFESYTAKYLEAAPSNSGTAQWGANGTAIGNGLTTWSTAAARDAGLQGSIGSGRKDTQIIVAHLGENESGRAAQVVNAASFGGYNDWFLPSLGELNELYKYWNDNGIPANLSPTTEYYFSSTQFEVIYAWGQDFISGVQTNVGRNYPSDVRAIRAF